MENRRYAEAAQEFQAALSLNPHLIQARYQLAICEFALARLKEARTELNQVEKEAPGNPEVTYYLGRLDLREGDYQQAIQELLKIGSSPPFPDTTYYLGSAYLNEGMLSEAEKWLLLAAKANPRDFRVADHLARLYQKQKKASQAEKEYARSMRLRQYYEDGAKLSIACDRALDTQPLNQARSVCQQIFDPMDQDKLILLGMIYGRHGDYHDALPPLEEAVRIDPDSWAAEHNLGLTYFRLRRYSDALAPLRKAVELRPEYFGSSALLGATLYTLQQDQEAFQALEHAHQLNPQDSDAAQLLFNEALIQARQRCLNKNYSGCLKFLHKASSLRPGDERIQRQIAEVERLANGAPE
jgi:tetratricopeptide (TPR) repeat protein